jgi:hypothetical protein
LKHSSITLICVLIGILLTACSPSENAPTKPNSSTGPVSTGPLPDAAYKASITPANPPPTLRAGEKAAINVKVKNAGNGVWPAQGQGSKYKVDLANHWLDSKGVAEVVGDDGRAALPHDLKPGDEAELVLTVKAPKSSGDYVLELDMVHEDVTWFKNHGSQTTKVNIRVQ